VQSRLWPRLLAWLAQEHDPESYAIDATYVRVHADGTHARGDWQAQAISRSRGGLTSKVHLLTDALGYPVRLVVTGGERNDVTQTPALLPPWSGTQVICDRGHDADWWRERLQAAGHEPVVPGRRNRRARPPTMPRSIKRATSSRAPSPGSSPPAASPPGMTRAPSATTPLSLWPASASGSDDFEDAP
jgi:hypothetical protein